MADIERIVGPALVAGPIAQTRERSADERRPYVNRMDTAEANRQRFIFPMNNPTIGLIGGGRVARIILAGWTRAAKMPAR